MATTAYGRDFGVPIDELLDHCGADALPTAVDHLFEPAGQSDVAVLVDRGHVPGLEEPVLVEGLGVLLGVSVVAGEHRGPLDQKLARRVRRQGVAVPVHHLVGVARASGPAHGRADRLDIVLGARDCRHALGGTVAVVKPNTEPSEYIPHQFRERRAPRAVHLLHAAQIELVDLLVLQQALRQGRHPDDRRHLLALDRLADGPRVGGIEHHQLALSDHAAHEALAEGEVVGDRPHDQVDVLAMLTPDLRAELDVADDAVVGAGHELRLSGGSSGRTHVSHLSRVRPAPGQASQISSVSSLSAINRSRPEKPGRRPHPGR